MFDNGTDRIYTEKVERHTHPSYTILAGLMLYMYARCSYRQVVKVMEVMRQILSPVIPWLFEDLPTHATIEDWAEKAGLAAMRSKAKSLDSAYALILDESVDIGGKKLLVGLAFNPECQGHPLGCKDVTVVEMGVAKSRSGEDIKASLEKITKETGNLPVYGLSDNGTNLDRGFELAGIPRHRDISHTFGSMLKSVYDDVEDFKEFVEQIGRSRRWTLTDNAVLMPPNMRSLARYMNVYDWIEWAGKVLDVYHRLSKDEKHYLGFVPRHASLVDELLDVRECMVSIMETCKNDGLSKMTAETCRKVIACKLLSSGNERMAKLGCKMLAYFDEELKLLKPDDKSHMISSDVIESMFGYYKGRKSPDKQAGITCSVLVIPLRTMFDPNECKPDDKIMSIFTSETVNSVAQWRKETIGDSNLAKRRKKLEKRA